MAAVVATAAAPVSPLGRWFAGLAGVLLTVLLGIAALGAVEALVARSTVLGSALALLLGAVVVLGLALVVKELAALSRMRSLARLRSTADTILGADDLVAARRFVLRLEQFYSDRPELRRNGQGMAARVDEAFDTDAVLALAERGLMKPLDDAARREVEAAARHVATVTALVPLALADLVAALVANLRMIRRIAEIYGGRGGTLGSWRLARGVLSHMAATGALAVSDDLIGSIAGGGVMSKVSRRFGEGVVNGALTARVGVAAMEVCRPLPFKALDRPSVGGLVKRALGGLFSTGAAG